MYGLGKHTVFLLLLFNGISLNAQEYGTKLEGRVYSKDGDVSATHVSNSTKNRGTITDINGFFAISASLNDTLVFSAVQFKKKEVVVTIEILKSKKLNVTLEDALTQLSEVVVMPYNLSGELNQDMNTLETGPIITASTVKLPNANLKKATQSERQLYTARTWDLEIGFGFKVKLDPLWNYFSGRTKMLNKRIARDDQSNQIANVRKFYDDSLYVRDLKIPKDRIGDFIYFCETDSTFSDRVTIQNKLKLWEFMKKRSLVYRVNNKLD